MRNITHIVIHCSATPEGKVFTAANIDRWHKAMGWKGIGYHQVVRLDGTIERGRPDDQIGSHVAGHNSRTIGICYIGGTDKDGKPKDTRTQAQKVSLAKLVREYLAKYPGAKVVGHRDFPGVKKACPSFDVSVWWAAESRRCGL
jgi:N-acetylmuramoyl-L-alanine amidase